MKRWIAFCLFSAAAVVLTVGEKINLSDYSCFKPSQINHRNARIVGGYNAERESTPYIAALTRSGGNVFCGASIISEKFLIAAAHCICTSQNKVMKTTQMRVYVGINKLSDIKQVESGDSSLDGLPQEVVIDSIIMHPDYVCGRKSDKDIALLQLKKAIQFNTNVRPLCLESDNGEISTHGVVSGFGMTHENYEIAVKPDILQSAYIPLWSNEECQTSYASISKSFVISNRQICAGGRNGESDSCYSDSGGPLVDSKSGALIGIVSNGIGCGRKGLPGIYVRVSQYTQWIQEQM